MNPFIRGIKTIRQVGLLPVLQLGLYRFGLLSGHYRRVSDSQVKTFNEQEFDWLKPIQSLNKSRVAGYLRDHPELSSDCLQEAEMVLAGKCRIFGHQVVDIFPDGFDSIHYWTEYESGHVKVPGEDIKFTWEPARLGWVYILARASVFNKNPDLGKRAWELIEKFLKSNPANCGPNWMNGQEVALRILALVFFHEVFKESPDMPEDWEHILAQAVAEHAQRIPPTLVYARSQQNNHLLVEAAGLYTAGVFLTSHPQAGYWRETGWQVFHQTLDDQIQDDGTYGQFSTNYHRLMLQIALWMKAISLRVGDEFPEISQKKLAAATNWLQNLVDPMTGLVPNYGHNDGAYILPLTGLSYHDFRPVIQAANLFFGKGLEAPDTDEMALWFEWLSGGQISVSPSKQQIPPVQSYRKLINGKTSVVMFAPQYKNRPGQADVLHTDIWRNGNPVTLDAGTYLYNGAPPWENVLSQSKFHNTVTVFQQNQMQKAGRFLWLDWPKVQLIPQRESEKTISAEHDGYKRYGAIHKRQVELVKEDNLKVIDTVFPMDNNNHSPIDVWLHWLLPALDWIITGTGIQGGENFEKISLDIFPSETGTLQPVEIQLITAGILVGGQNNQETSPEDLVNFGWVSPTYAQKIPAYSYRVLFRGKPPVKFYTQFQFG